MSSKRIYKVTLTGWVVKNEDDSEVNEWTKESILDAIVGEQLMVNFIDSNDMVVTPTRSDVVPEKRKPGRPPKVHKAEAEKAENAKAKELRLAAVYGAGDKKLEELEEKWDGIIQEANVDNTDKYLTDPAQDGINAVKEEIYAGPVKEPPFSAEAAAEEAFNLIEAKDEIDKRQADESDELIALSYQPGTNSQDPDGPVYDESDEPPLVMDFEGDDEEVDDSEMSL